MGIITTRQITNNIILFLDIFGMRKLLVNSFSYLLFLDRLKNILACLNQFGREMNKNKFLAQLLPLNVEAGALSFEI